MGSIKDLIEKQIPGIYVRSLMIGDNVFEVSKLFPDSIPAWVIILNKDLNIDSGVTMKGMDGSRHPLMFRAFLKLSKALKNCFVVRLLIGGEGCHVMACMYCVCMYVVIFYYLLDSLAKKFCSDPPLFLAGDATGHLLYYMKDFIQVWERSNGRYLVIPIRMNGSVL